MKPLSFFLLFAALAGVLGLPHQKVKVVKVYRKVVHVVTSTHTVWVKAPKASSYPKNPYGKPKPKPKPKSKTPAPSYKVAPPTYQPPAPPKVVVPAPTYKPAKPAKPVKPEYKPKPKPEYKPKPKPEYKPKPKPIPTPYTPPPPVTYVTPSIPELKPKKPTYKPVKVETTSSSSGGIVGKATFYRPGIGSCGVPSTETENIVAISYILMDAKNPGNPNNNPLCGKKIKASRNGSHVVCTVVDRCPSCDGTTIDLSPNAFNTLGNPDEGRIDIEWEWLD
jgi:hypothetical protein